MDAYDADDPRLTDLLPLLRQQGYAVDHMSYAALRDRAQAGRVPGAYRQGHVWRVRGRDPAAIAAAAAALKLRKGVA